MTYQYICYQMLFSFIVLVCSHMIADFCFQTRWQATNKSKNWIALSSHVLSYTITVGFAALVLVSNFINECVMWNWVVWTCFNGLAHFATDAITSRVTSAVYIASQTARNAKTQDEFMKLFWTWIGTGQAINLVTLAWSYVYFIEPYNYMSK